MPRINFGKKVVERLLNLEITGSEDNANLMLNQRQLLCRGSREYCLNYRRSLLLQHPSAEWQVPNNDELTWSYKDEYEDWTPANASNLEGWWKGDAGITLTSNFVSGWADQSGNGNDLAGTVSLVFGGGVNGVAYTADKTLEFEKTEQLSLSSADLYSLDDDYAIITVAKVTNLPVDQFPPNTDTAILSCGFDTSATKPGWFFGYNVQKRLEFAVHNTTIGAFGTSTVTASEVTGNAAFRISVAHISSNSCTLKDNGKVIGSGAMGRAPNIVNPQDKFLVAKTI